MVIPSRAWIVSVEMAKEWLMTADITGRLHGIDPVLGRISWSKTVIDGSLRVTAVNEDEDRIAFVAIDDDFRMVISVFVLRDLTKMVSYSEGIPEDMAFTTPTCAAWIPHNAISGWFGDTLVIGTNEGQVYAWAGNGKNLTLVDLDEEIVGLHWDEYSYKLVVATRKGHIFMVDVNKQLVASQFTTDFVPPRSLVSFDYHTEARRMAVGGSDGQVEVWDMTNLHRTQTIRYHNFSLADVAWANGTHLVSSGRFASLAVWGPDKDGDMRADEVDAFPTDRSEWTDTDGDGVGDNGDMFPT
ncbi:MAG: hypothetical protein GWN18_02080, partial [Thermoplasmata archaeon]|nr:hypothetical protein [Thermoplasmata archaeon]NIS10797.1 hypothetical protein [Thermoplasmata archaeon]NIV77545.1 hypothetical protein [Thermoplasmata archaeon]NIW81374.1 hypothetical protein [Thermoplasmata archaeon]